VYPPTTVKTHATKRSLELPSINLFAAVERALTAGDECADILMLLAAIRGGVNGLMGEILEDHIRLHMMTPDQKMDSPEELGEDLILRCDIYCKEARR
jgi:DNA-binding FrmR family transcriptional regulator